MKRFKIQRACVALVCLVAILGFTGCDDDDPPENIAGVWNCVISGAYAGEAFTSNETMTIEQNGQTVTGSFTYTNWENETYTFNGTYVDGVLNAVDSDNWIMRIDFEDDNSAEGTLTGKYDNGEPGIEIITLSR